MKRILAALLIVLTAPAATAYAAGGNDTPDESFPELFEEQSDAAGVKGLEKAAPEAAGEILGDMKVTDALDPEGVISRLVSGVTGKLREIAASSMKGAAAVAAAALLSGIFSSALPGGSGNYAKLSGVLAVSAASVSSVHTFIGMGDEVLHELGMFSKALLPCLATAAAASGGITSAAIKYSATVLFFDFTINAMRSLIMPLIYAYAAVSVAEAAVSAAGGVTGADALAGVSALIKWLAKTALTCFVLAFIVYTSLTGVIASASDAVAVRAAKVTISTVLPVVGGILADAADTVMSGAALLRNAIGVFGALVAAAVCAVPFIKLGANYILYRAAGGLSGAAADKSVTKLIDAFGAAFGLTLGMTGVTAIMLFVSIVSTIKALV